MLWYEDTGGTTATDWVTATTADTYALPGWDTDNRLQRNVPGWHYCPGVRLVVSLPVWRLSLHLPTGSLWHRRIAPGQLSCGWRNYRVRR